MNRYSQISTSKFDPLSLDEVMAVPLFKQRKYDELEAQRVATQEAFKVDPLDVHKEKAQQLQNDFNAKADELARYQLKTGDLQGAKTKMLQLRQEYKKLMDPMGDVSKINSANKAFQDEKIRFLEGASKQYGSTRALELWNQHANTYKGYDDKGNVKNIDSKGIVANQDFMKDVKEFHDLMGKTTSSIAGSDYKIVERPEGLVMVNSSGKTVTNNNFEQLKNAENALRSKWINPTGEGTLYNIEAGKNPQEFENYFKNTMYSQRESGVNRDSNTSASFIGPKTTETSSNLSGVFGEDYNTSEVGNTEKEFNEISKIGSNIPNTGSVGSNYTMGTGTEGGPKQKSGLYTHNDIDDPRLKARYIATFKKLFKEGKIKTTIDNPNSAKIVLNEIKKQGPLTLTTKMLTNDVDLNNSGFAESIGKTADDRDKQIRKQLKLTNAGARKLLDPETGKVISFEEAKEKYNLKGVDAVTYHGYVSPLNWEKESFDGTNSKASPHIITVEDKNGNFVEFKTSRLSSDNVGININRYNDLNTNYRNWSINHDEFIPFESKSPNLNKLKVKYNTINPTIDPERGVLDITILDSNGVPHEMTQAEFVNSVNATK